MTGTTKVAGLPLEECGPLHEDVLEKGYRNCDFCYESAVDDIHAGRLHESEWRKFYFSTDGSGLTVCGNCVDAFEDSLQP